MVQLSMKSAAALSVFFATVIAVPVAQSQSSNPLGGQVQLNETTTGNQSAAAGIGSNPGALLNVTDNNNGQGTIQVGNNQINETLVDNGGTGTLSITPNSNGNQPLVGNNGPLFVNETLQNGDTGSIILTGSASSPSGVTFNQTVSGSAGGNIVLNTNNPNGGGPISINETLAGNNGGSIVITDPNNNNNVLINQTIAGSNANITDVQNNLNATISGNTESIILTGVTSSS